MKTIIIVSLLSLSLTGHVFSTIKNPAKKQSSLPNRDTTVCIFSLPVKGFGFDILIGNKVLIHQPFIPALQGNHGFSNKADAKKTAAFMLFKLKNFGMHPSISTVELDSLHIHITK